MALTMMVYFVSAIVITIPILAIIVILVIVASAHHFLRHHLKLKDIQAMESF
jgi:hypothetical protein